MALYSLQPLSFPSLMHDALLVVGVGGALLAGLAFISLGHRMPGPRTSHGGHHGDRRGEHLEFGSSTAPLISGPTPRRAPSLEPNPDPRKVARRHRWPAISESAVLHPAPVRAVMVWTVTR